MKKILALTMAVLMALSMTMWVVAAFAAPGMDAAPTDTETVYEAAAVAELPAVEPYTETEKTDVPTVTEAVGSVISAGVKLILAVVTLILTKYVIPFAKNTVAPFVRETIIPWLKEHRLKALAESLVHGAEQLAKSGQITKEAKLQYVLDALKSKGVEITEEVRMIVEGAVLDLDKTGKGLIQVVLEILEDWKASLEDGLEAGGEANDGAAVKAEAPATATAEEREATEAHAEPEAAGEVKAAEEAHEEPGGQASAAAQVNGEA